MINFNNGGDQHLKHKKDLDGLKAKNTDQTPYLVVSRHLRCVEDGGGVEQSRWPVDFVEI